MQDGKKLASSEELKGKRSRESGGKKKNSFLLRGLLLVLAVGLAAGIYYFSGKVQPEAKEQPTATTAQD